MQNNSTSHNNSLHVASYPSSLHVTVLLYVDVADLDHVTNVQIRVSQMFFFFPQNYVFAGEIIFI